MSFVVLHYVGGVFVGVASGRCDGRGWSLFYDVAQQLAQVGVTCRRHLSHAIITYLLVPRAHLRPPAFHNYY